MDFPPPPTTSIDWADVGFKVREVNGHVESTYSLKTGAWTPPKFVTDPYLRLHGMAPGLNYGQQCYEGLKAFRDPTDKVINIFRPTSNAARMRLSAGFVAMPAVPDDIFLTAVHLAVARNAEFVPPHATGASMYIRPLLFGSSAQLGLNPPEEYTFLVYVLPTGVYHGTAPVPCLVLDDFDRAAPDGVGAAKVGGNYAPVIVHSEKARQKGYGITLHLDSKTRTYIDEFSTSGFLAIKYGVGGAPNTLVVADSKNVIKSITSNSVQQIAKDLGWNVEVRPVRFEECSGFDEVMAAGTAAALVPIKTITRLSSDSHFDYNCDKETPKGAAELKKILREIQSGIREDRHGWRDQVKEEDLRLDSN